MAWDFSVEAMHKASAEKILQHHLTSVWEISDENRQKLIFEFEKKGFQADFFSKLTTCLYSELGLYVSDVLDILNVKTFFDRRSKSANFATNLLFGYWNNGYANGFGQELVQTNSSSAFLDRNQILDLVYWLEICAAILSDEPLYLYDVKEPIFIEALQYCANKKTDDDMQNFSFYYGGYQHLKWDIENSDLDLFFWFNSY